ncbi:MAG: DUF4180 domain-containing protein [Pseudonocardia sp.]|nr:DUF4180 domain-containing protein [Pseudonocardia sp.]
MTTPNVHTVPADGPPVAGEQDALDLLGDAFGVGADVVVVPVERLSPEFFRLRTGVAGAVVQKFVNYRVRLVVLGDVSGHVDAGGPTADWIRETGRGRDVWFVADETELERRLAAVD